MKLCVASPCQLLVSDLKCKIYYTATLFFLQIKMHLIDPFQEKQRGQQRDPKCKEMVQQLEVEVIQYGGWDNV